MSGNRNITNLYDQFGDEAVWFYSIMGVAMTSSTNLVNQPQSYANNKTMNYADVWGSSNSYSLSEVKSDTSTSYELQVTTAANFTIGATFDYNAEMLAPGSYRIQRNNQPWGTFPSDGNLTLKNATLDNVVVNNVIINGQMRGALVVVADLTVSKTDLSISSMTTSVQGYLSGDFELKNYPRSQVTYETVPVNYYYESVGLMNRTFNNYNISVSSNISSNLAMTFLPALDIYHFPISGGESWTVASKAIITGTMGGNLNVIGLPSDLQNNIFTNNPYNMTGFPINLANVFNPNMKSLQNGTISTEKNISLSIRASGPRTIYDPTLGTINVFDLQYNNTSTSASSVKVTILADKARIVGISSPGMKPTSVQMASDAIKLITQEAAAKPTISKRTYTSRNAPGMVASIPTWNVGDKWALTGTKDLEAMFNALGEDKASLLSVLTSSVYTNSQAVRNKTLDSADLWGKISSSAVIEVVGQTSTDYQLKVRVGADVIGGLYYSYNADILNPGNYQTNRYSNGAPWGFLTSDSYANLSSASSTNKDVTYQGSVDGATYMDATVTVSRTNLSIGSIVMTSSAFLNADIVAKNVPKTNGSSTSRYDYTEGYNDTINQTWVPGAYYYASANLLTVKSSDYTYSFDLKDDLNLTVLFSDYLQVMKFPMTAGDTWSKSTHIDVEGNISGHLDVTGLSAEANASLMKALDLVNVNSLPIDFTKMYNPNSTRFNNGTISFQTVIEPSFKCVKSYLVDDAIAGQSVAFQIIPTTKISYPSSALLGSMFSFDYLSNAGRLSSVNMNFYVTLGMKATPAANAEAALSKISTAVSQGFESIEPTILSTGSVLELHQNQAMTISVDGNEQTIELISSNSTSSVFRVGGSSGQEITLGIGEVRELDLNGDGKNDLSLRLTSTTGSSADFSIINLSSSSGTGSGTGTSNTDITMIAAVAAVVAIVIVVAAVMLVRKKRRA